MRKHLPVSLPEIIYSASLSCNFGEFITECAQLFLGSSQRCLTEIRNGQQSFVAAAEFLKELTYVGDASGLESFHRAIGETKFLDGAFG